MQQIAIFGATGSIGRSTLDVLRIHRDKYQVFALTGYNNVQLLEEQCKEFAPTYAWLPNEKLAQELSWKLKNAAVKTEVLCKKTDLNYLAAHNAVDIVMSAMVGSAGLLPTYSAALAGKRILLANKESLVAGGKLITEAVANNNASLIPVDSEHNAIYQALPYGYTNLNEAGVNKIILTASGGPFLYTPYEELINVTAAQAIKHPNWNMGHKISVDSATLMNKGLEVIEAYWLFHATLEQLEVVIHPQSIIHSMVEYKDNSIIAQLGAPDMKIPITYALSAPKRINSGSAGLDFTTLNALTFQKPDLIRFPCLRLALEGLAVGGSSLAVINASNEVAVAQFLQGKIKFYAIPAMIEQALSKFVHTSITTLEELLDLDQQVRDFCSAT